MKHKGPITLDEASLSRAYQHVVDKKEPSWGIVTAHRTTFSKKENEARNKQLEKDVRGMGYGFFKMEGHWRECQDTSVSYEDCPPEKLKDATETPLFIPGIKENQLKKLSNKYDQDSVIYGDTKEDEAKLIFRNGNETKIGKFHPGKVAQAYSKIKGGRTFTFEPGDAHKKSPDTELGKSLRLKPLMQSILDKKVRNPETGKDIQIRSALQYDKKSPVFQAAKTMITKKK